jgi:23S rRNA pseudouridine2605 synthase
MKIEPPAENVSPHTTPPAAERLQKVLAAAGFGSRRHCEELILAGRVTVERTVVTELGTRVDPAAQKIFVDGERIKVERKRYFLLCKPTGVVCTAHDPAGRTKAIDLVPKDFGRLFTVGRLDENSEGLLLVTNDGELAHRLAHPRFQVERRYRVLVAGQPTSKVFDELKQGIYFTEGKFRVRDVRRVGSKGQSTILELTLTEGQNREIRRLLARVGHKVMALMRVAFGPLLLGTLQPGAYRELSHHEVKSLQEFADGKKPPRAKPTSKSVPKSTGGPNRRRIGPNAKRSAPARSKRRG